MGSGELVQIELSAAIFFLMLISVMAVCSSIFFLELLFSIFFIQKFCSTDFSKFYSFFLPEFCFPSFPLSIFSLNFIPEIFYSDFLLATFFLLNFFFELFFCIEFMF